MNNVKEFLTEEQLATVLTSGGTCMNQNGDWISEDETLGSELERFFKVHNEPLLVVSAIFDTYDKYESDDPADGPTGDCLGITHFVAWTENHILLVLNSLFNDKYLAVLDRHPISNPEVVVNAKQAD